MGKLSNVTREEFERFLRSLGYSLDRTSGGHNIWKGPLSNRSIVVQTHISPVPVSIILGNLKTMGIDRKELEDFLKK